MTNENIFKEIEEDLERQRYEELWKRYGGLVIAVALAIVLGTAGYNFWQGHTQEMHQKATGDLAALVASKEDQTKKLDALAQFAANNPGQTQASFAALHAAALAAQQDKKDDAIKIYDSVAADTKADHAFRQLADLLSVEVQLDNGDPAKLQNRLQPLMAANEPWRFSAKEYSAFLALRSGDKVKAVGIFTDLSHDAETPASLRARATDMLRLLSE